MKKGIYFSLLLVIDDVLTFGSTVAGSYQQIEKLGGKVIGCTFVIELEALKVETDCRLSNS